MKTHLFRIGNSRRFRIQKSLLEQIGPLNEVQIDVGSNRPAILSSSHPRAGWDEAFQAMTRQGDDALLDGGDLLTTQWDEEEWTSRGW